MKHVIEYLPYFFKQLNCNNNFGQNETCEAVSFVFHVRLQSTYVIFKITLEVGMRINTIFIS